MRVRKRDLAERDAKIERLEIDLATATGILHAWSELLRQVDGMMLGTMTRTFLGRNRDDIVYGTFGQE
jgi:hypothetical protein